MWLQFKNNVLVNLEKVVKIEYTEYGPGMVFHCVDTSFRLVLKDLDTRNKFFKNICDLLEENTPFSVKKFDIEVWS